MKARATPGKRIVWLASYPKSGNTWFRAFLQNFARNTERPAPINALDLGWLASARERFDEALGFDSAELTFDEVDALRPEVYRHWADAAPEALYCKVHDAFQCLPDGRAFFPADATFRTLYFVRNPLDVCVSFAHHTGNLTIDRMVRCMGNPEFTFCGQATNERPQLRQRLLTWSGHVTSWLDAPGMRTLVIRYEDMKRHPMETFTQAVRFLELPEDTERIARALRFSSFEELRRQEEAEGFCERTPNVESFFRKGEIGSWREKLQPEHVRQLLVDHSDVMRRCGYLDETGQLLY